MRVAQPKAASPGLVLVVDDSELVRTIVRHDLEEAGFEVVEAASGDEALGALGGQHAIRCVVTDLEMPGMSGLDLIRAIRSGARKQHMPIVVLSGSQARDEAFDVGANGFFAKPCAGKELVRAVEAMVNERGTIRG